jgi:drug/metabolite transporter (DMT)-like permease
MSRALATVLMLSVLGLLMNLIYVDLVASRRKRFGPSTLLLLVAAAIYASAFSSDIESKGAVQESVAVVFCYLSMVLGMVAQYCYGQAERGAEKLTFKPMEFLMPIFASPIVFIPLLTITADIALSGAFTKSKLMVYFVAFQNGFFWKSFFERRRREMVGAVPAALKLEHN